MNDDIERRLRQVTPLGARPNSVRAFWQPRPGR